jgi:hypothetical protein
MLYIHHDFQRYSSLNCRTIRWYTRTLKSLLSGQHLRLHSPYTGVPGFDFWLGGQLSSFRFLVLSLQTNAGIVTKVFHEVQSLLGCTVMFTNRCRPTFQRCVLPPSSGRCVIALMMEVARTCETSVDIDLRTQQYISEDPYLHTRRRENLKSHKVFHDRFLPSRIPF